MTISVVAFISHNDPYSHKTNSEVGPILSYLLHLSQGSRSLTKLSVLVTQTNDGRECLMNDAVKRYLPGLECENIKISNKVSSHVDTFEFLKSIVDKIEKHQNYSQIHLIYSQINSVLEWAILEVSKIKLYRRVVRLNYPINKYKKQFETIRLPNTQNINNTNIEFRIETVLPAYRKFLKKKCKFPLFIKGCCGSGKTELAKQICKSQSLCMLIGALASDEVLQNNTVRLIQIDHSKSINLTDFNTLSYPNNKAVIYELHGEINMANMNSIDDIQIIDLDRTTLTSEDYLYLCSNFYESYKRRFQMSQTNFLKKVILDGRANSSQRDITLFMHQLYDCFFMKKNIALRELPESLPELLTTIEKHFIKIALNNTHNESEAAKLLGIKANTLRKKVCNQFNIRNRKKRK